FRGQFRPSLNNENGGKRAGMPLLSPSLQTECLQNLSLRTGPSHSRTSSQPSLPPLSLSLYRDFFLIMWWVSEPSNVEGMRERKCEGEVVDDMFNAYLNLNNLGRLNTFRAENGEDLDSRANGTKANGVSEKREGIKRSGGGSIAPTTRHYRRVSINSAIDTFNLEFGNGLFNGVELKKIMANENLAEMALTDPKSVKRYKEHRWDLKQLIESGGMPPSHSAIVTALAIVVGLHDGLDGSTFATVLILACIAMYDATGVRLHAGRQAEDCCRYSSSNIELEANAREQARERIATKDD
ncbi:probable transcription factor PosF21, partial [Tanacetum coccineum]